MRQQEDASEAEALMDKEEKLAQERARDKVKRWLVACQRGRVEESEQENEEDEEEEGDEEDEDKLKGLSSLSAKVRGKGPMK